VESKIKLYLFDLDGTLAPFDSNTLYPDAAMWLKANHDQMKVIVTNQMETAGFGEPAKYPTSNDFLTRVRRLFPDTLGNPFILMCARYQSKSSSKWCPIPPGCEGLNEWSTAWRKPEPGMLIYAMSTFGAEPEETLMVGDSDEDKAAAENAGVKFRWAWDFFGREQPEPAQSSS
jgi:HAD superfamily hydrolase (TIGR01662 family)